MLLLLLNEQDMKDQMSNSSMQALAERKNRQVRTRNGQCISATKSVLSGQTSGVGRGSHAAARLGLSCVHLAALGELFLTGCQPLPSLSQSSKSALTICFCLQSWLFTTVSIAPSHGKGNLPPPPPSWGEAAQNPCQ